jgi:hypothetical protein
MKTSHAYTGAMCATSIGFIRRCDLARGAAVRAETPRAGAAFRGVRDDCARSLAPMLRAS